MVDARHPHFYEDFGLGYIFIYKDDKRLIRIELTLIAWKAIVLPLNYRRAKGEDYAGLLIFMPSAFLI
jgi:hypothetical protein